MRKIFLITLFIIGLPLLQAKQTEIDKSVYGAYGHENILEKILNETDAARSFDFKYIEGAGVEVTGSKLKSYEYKSYPDDKNRIHHERSYRGEYKQQVVVSKYKNGSESIYASRGDRSLPVESSFVKTDSKGALEVAITCYEQNCIALTAEKCRKFNSTKKMKLNDFLSKLSSCFEITEQMKELFSYGLDESRSKEISEIDPLAKQMKVNDIGMLANLEQMMAWSSICANQNMSKEVPGVSPAQPDGH